VSGNGSRKKKRQLLREKFETVRRRDRQVTTPLYGEMEKMRGSSLEKCGWNLTGIPLVFALLLVEKGGV